jgi:NAD(P)-dependent dehydrogenase (short-subunit alcohol dehydrogenase family)
MSSGQGSVADNTNGMRELYRGSKAALTMFMRSFAASGKRRERIVEVVGISGVIAQDRRRPLAGRFERLPRRQSRFAARLDQPGRETLQPPPAPFLSLPIEVVPCHRPHAPEVPHGEAARRKAIAASDTT